MTLTEEEKQRRHEKAIARMQNTVEFEHYEQQTEKLGLGKRVWYSFIFSFLFILTG
jgi:hypothetical protein